MTAHAQNIVEFPSVETELSEIAGDIAASKAALVKGGGKGGKIGGGKSQTDVLPPIGDIRYDDLHNAERFLQMTGDDLLYCNDAKKWLCWKETHWAWDNDDTVFEWITMFAADLYSRENLAASTEEGRKAAHAHAKRSNNRAGLNAMLEISQRKQSASIDTFDAPHYLINCKNGTLDLRTGSLKEHDRADRITRIVNCDYDADAFSPAFDKFITRIQPDPSIRAFLQRSIGYSLLGEVPEHTFWILYGTGNNGKSIFTNLFLNLLGEYGSTTPTSTIMKNKHGGGIPNDIARLKGKRFVVVPETGENEQLNESLIKALSAGDKVSARFLFGEYFDFFFSGKIWIATNHKPTITDPSHGLWRRLKLIPFNVNIPDDEVEKSDVLMNKLMADAPAVLNWAVQGCRDYFDLDGLDTPDCIQTEIDAYRREQDSIAQFIEERCETGEQGQLRLPDAYFNKADYRVSNKDLYAAYKEFCQANGEYLRSHRRLTQNMHERGFRQLNSGGRYWDGVKLLNTAE